MKQWKPLIWPVMKNLVKMLAGAVIIVAGCIGLFVSHTDMVFLFLNLAFIGLGLLWFLTPLLPGNEPPHSSRRSH